MDVAGYKYNIYRVKQNGSVELESKALLNEKERLRTFYTKHHTFPHHIPTPSSLARAGFHFTGEDDPIKEHKFWFPSCPFVLGKF
ncbi:hypothetical protein B4U80_11303, partial [Leptotrombidium deliense]